MNVLIVDDNANDRRLLRYTLEHHGCTVIEARDGQEGLYLAIRHKPDVIVSDALMPRMDGFQLLRTLKSDPDLRSIPFLFCSATYIRHEEERLALSLGAKAFLVKPTEPEVFWEKICEVFRTSEQREENPVRQEPVESEEEYLAEYIRIVATKLEEKVQELEEVMGKCRKSEEELRRTNSDLSLEIAERKKVEERLKASLEEKEVLLREVHHRVKNNLQIVSSLLDLQYFNINDKQAVQALRATQDRIKSMALVHEKLYLTTDVANIDFTIYLESLTEHLCNSYLIDPEQVSLVIDVENVKLSIDKAIPCGLIINELVSNSLKYAFPQGRQGIVAIRLHEDEKGNLILSVTDDGVGLPAGMDFSSTGSMGLQLVNLLTRQLRGEISLSNEKGTAFTIRF
jgi:two-component sensor histidine kinase/DNA-binding NarL/FixJ family response regulator